MYKPIPIEEKLKKNWNLVFSGPKVLLFCLKSGPWTGNELKGDDVENCENLQISHIFCNFASVSVEIPFKQN